MTIEAPVHEVARLDVTITYVGGGQATFTMDGDSSQAQGEQPWIGKSADIREAISVALADAEFWDDGNIECPNCGERVAVNAMNYWPDLKEPVSMCDSCEHNARRSGWEPGQ